ncbi:MAG: hypothetical protein ACREUC_17090, partial [Steroidobacteraceae bacterium]
MHADTRAAHARGTRRAHYLIGSLCALTGACATPPAKQEEPPAAKRTTQSVAYPSTYSAASAPATLIRGATILTGTGTRIDNGDVLIANGRIESVGQSLSAPAGARVIEANGRWVTPGLIDVHSHLGVYPSPGINAHNDGNEMTDPVTPNVWAEHA